jgi:hypothetical protein
MTFEADIAKKPQHVTGHFPIDEQLSHGFALCGQQSMSSIAAISVMSVMAVISAMSVDFTAILIPAVAGNLATEIAMRITRMVRPTFMAQPSRRSRFSNQGRTFKY